MPSKTTDGVALKSPVAAQICREKNEGACEPVATQPFAPGRPAAFDDLLPTELTTSSPVLLTYRVELRNRHGKSAGPSNPAWTVSGAPPAPVTGLTATVRAGAVLLTWQPAPQPAPPAPSRAPSFLRIERERVGVAPAPTPPRPGAQNSLKSPVSLGLAQPAAAPAEQTLIVRPQPGAEPLSRALDNTAVLGQTYRYTVRRVRNVQLAGHDIEIEGAASAPITVLVESTVPPSIPVGLIAAADPADHAVDLSWTPNPEPDLAGYIVYRRTAGSSLPPARISDAKAPEPAPAFRDTTAVDGQRYAYSVSAVDQSGHESARSPEVDEGLPPGTGSK